MGAHAVEHLRTVSDCIFCAISSGQAEASVVHQDDTVIAFLDTGPVNPGHLLVVPRVHAAQLVELDEATGAAMFVLGMRLERALRRTGLRCEGVNFFLADGAAAFQEVFHVHLHVLPRFEGDSFKIDADWSVHPERTELDAIAEQIRRAL